MLYLVGIPEKIYTEGDVRRCLIFADETPDELPTTGSGIEGLPDNCVLYRGSMIMAWDTGKTYCLGGDGTWRKWGE